MTSVRLEAPNTFPLPSMQSVLFDVGTTFWVLLTAFITGVSDLSLAHDLCAHTFGNENIVRLLTGD